jgi:O-antigen/teichoic acid export membrane protein
MGNLITSYIEKIKNNDFLRNTIILFIASMIMNLAFFIFQIYLGKLGPVEYGVFGALTYLIFLLILPLTNGIQTIVTKFVSNHKISNEYGKINSLFTKSVKTLLIWGVLISLVFMIFSRIIANFLHIDSIWPLFWIALIFISSLLIAVIRGILQGLQKFKGLGVNFILEGLLKLIGGVILVEIGLGINGALIAIMFSYLIPFFISLYSLRAMFKIKKDPIELRGIYSYSFPVLIAMFFLAAFYSIDVILVKHFLSAQEAGYYVATSLLAKIVYFGSMAITMVLFPQVNELHIKKQDHKKLLLRAIGIVLLLTLCITLFYFLFPVFILKVIGFYKSYSIISSYIGWFGLAMSIFSLAYVISFYNLSINRTKFVYILGFFVLLEIILISLYHNSIIEIIRILLTLLSFLLLSMVIYTWYKK